MVTAQQTHSDTAVIEGDWMDAEEYLAKLRPTIGRSTFYRLAGDDALPIPTHRVGRKYVFSRRAYERLRDAQHSNGSDIA